jgi:MYXO-CTERM domain-containing protein
MPANARGSGFARCARMKPFRRRLLVSISFLSVVLAVDVALGATRVFHDGFETGLSDVWQADGARKKCTVENDSVDQVAPHSGSSMLECNWNGEVSWDNPEAYRTLVLSTWKYDKEFFIRYWIRYSADVDHAFGNKVMRLGSQWYNELYLAAQMEQAPDAPMFSYFESLGGEPGTNIPGPMSYGDGQAFGDGAWHEVEIHIVQNSPGQEDGSVKIWQDGVVKNEGDNLVTVADGMDWYPIYVMSNWSNNPGWEHDAANHVYWDDFEIFSDDSTGDPVTGSMLDGTIAAENGTSNPDDAGTRTPDAGGEGDGGSQSNDAGVLHGDAGKPGPGADATDAPSASASGDDGGCSTSVAGSPARPIALVLGLVLVVFARRRRS